MTRLLGHGLTNAAESLFSGCDLEQSFHERLEATRALHGRQSGRCRAHSPRINHTLDPHPTDDVSHRYPPHLTRYNLHRDRS